MEDLKGWIRPSDKLPEKSYCRKFLVIVKNKEEEIFIDKTGKANGRGAYLCNDKNCLEKAIKTNVTTKTNPLKY